MTGATASRQAPFGSGFGTHTTAAEVLAGIDLTGRTALVTGGYSGIGLEITRALSAAGADVLVPARRPDVAAEALVELLADSSGGTITLGELDLSDQAGVASYADSLIADGTPIDLVLANAGIMATPEERTVEGWELQLATNHLGHFALVNRIWPLISDDARIAVTSSGGHHYGGMRWDDPHFLVDDYDKWLGYGQSKTANILFAVELDRRGRDRGIHAWSLHPGAILTPLGRHLVPSDAEALLNSHDSGEPLELEFKSAEAGAATSVWAVTDDRLLEHGGAFLEDCDVAWLVEQTAPDGSGVKGYALDPEAAVRLWELSARLTGVDAFTTSGGG